MYVNLLDSNEENKEFHTFPAFKMDTVTSQYSAFKTSDQCQNLNPCLTLIHLGPARLKWQLAVSHPILRTDGLKSWTSVLEFTHKPRRTGLTLKSECQTINLIYRDDKQTMGLHTGDRTMNMQV